MTADRLHTKSNHIVKEIEIMQQAVTETETGQKSIQRNQAHFLHDRVLATQKSTHLEKKKKLFR